MPRKIDISLVQRKVCVIAELLENVAPQTCDAVWRALPLEGPAFHAKRAHNEVYTLVAPFAPRGLHQENGTIFPAMRDVAYFYFPPERVGNYIAGNKRYMSQQLQAIGLEQGIVDLAIFYGRNNFLFNFLGPSPCYVFATMTEGFERMAEACEDVWYAGAKGETLRFRRYEE